MEPYAAPTRHDTVGKPSNTRSPPTKGRRADFRIDAAVPHSGLDKTQSEPTPLCNTIGCVVFSQQREEKMKLALAVMGLGLSLGTSVAQAGPFDAAISELPNAESNPGFRPGAWIPLSDLLTVTLPTSDPLPGASVAAVTAYNIQSNVPLRGFSSASISMTGYQIAWSSCQRIVALKCF
jgi:hypothetical protein